MVRWCALFIQALLYMDMALRPRSAASALVQSALFLRKLASSWAASPMKLAAETALYPFSALLCVHVTLGQHCISGLRFVDPQSSTMEMQSLCPSLNLRPSQSQE